EGLRTEWEDKARSSLSPQHSVLGIGRSELMLRRLNLFALMLAAVALAAALWPASPPARAAAASDDVPAWLKTAAASTAPAYDKDVPGVVVNDESTMTVGEDGRVTTVTTYAVRLLTRAGFEE